MASSPTGGSNGVNTVMPGGTGNTSGTPTGLPTSASLGAQVNPGASNGQTYTVIGHSQTGAPIYSSAPSSNTGVPAPSSPVPTPTAPTPTTPTPSGTSPTPSTTPQTGVTPPGATGTSTGTTTPTTNGTTGTTTPQTTPTGTTTGATSPTAVPSSTPAVTPTGGNIPGTNIPLPTTPTPTPVPQAPVEDFSSFMDAINDETSSYSTSLSQLNDQSDSMFSNVESQMGQIEQGTYFTPAQQQLLDSTNALNATLRQQQVIANSAYQQGVLTSEGRTGELQGGTTTALGNYAAAVNRGLLQLNQMTASQAQSLATMENGFETQNLSAVKDEYDVYTSYESQKQSTLQDIYNAATSAQEEQENFIEKQLQDNFSDVMSSSTLDWNEKQQIMQYQLSESSLDEKTQQDLKSDALQEESNNIAAGQLALAQGTFDETWNVGGTSTSLLGGSGSSGSSATSTGNTNPVVTTINGQTYDANGDPTNGNGNPLNSNGTQPSGGLTYNASKGGFFDANGNQVTGAALASLQNGLGQAGIKIYSDGLAFYDESALSGSPKATAYMNQAQGANLIPLAPGDASIVTNLESAKTQLENMEKAFSQVNAPGSAFTRPISGVENLASTIFNPSGQTAQSIAQYNSYHASLISLMNELSGAKRVNGEEINIGTMALPTIDPSGLPTVSGTAQAQFSAFENQLNAQISSFIPGFNPVPNSNTASPDTLLTFGANGGSMPVSSGSTSTTIANNSAF